MPQHKASVPLLPRHIETLAVSDPLPAPLPELMSCMPGINYTATPLPFTDSTSDEVTETMATTNDQLPIADTVHEPQPILITSDVLALTPEVNIMSYAISPGNILNEMGVEDRSLAGSSIASPVQSGKRLCTGHDTFTRQHDLAITEINPGMLIPEVEPNGNCDGKSVNNGHQHSTVVKHEVQCNYCNCSEEDSPECHRCDGKCIGDLSNMADTMANGTHGCVFWKMDEIQQNSTKQPVCCHDNDMYVQTEQHFTNNGCSNDRDGVTEFPEVKVANGFGSLPCPKSGVGFQVGRDAVITTNGLCNECVEQTTKYICQSEQHMETADNEDDRTDEKSYNERTDETDIRHMEAQSEALLSNKTNDTTGQQAANTVYEVSAFTFKLLKFVSIRLIGMLFNHVSLMHPSMHVSEVVPECVRS